MKRFSLLFAILSCCALGRVWADPTLSATDFLKQSMSRYQSLKSFGVQCAWSDSFPGLTSSSAPAVESSRTILYAAPNHFKVVSSRPGFVQTSVCDGQHVAEYTNMASLSAQTYPAPASLAAAATMQMEHPMFCGTLLYKFFGGPDNLSGLVQASKAPISFGPDVTVDSEPCKTVTFYGTGLYGHAQVAISTRDSLVRRIVYDSAPLMAMMHDPSHAASLKNIPKAAIPTHSTTTELYTQFQIDSVIADNAFDTTIPKGQTATDMAQSGTEPPVPLGQPAPDFKITSAGGHRSVQLSSLRGKVVMLDFWATWCPPCRRSLPETQALAAQYSGKGLAVMAISDEDAGTITHFLQANHYTFPTYRDASKDVDKGYKITAIPTIAVIDRAGKLSAFFVGLQEPATVLAALQKAGLETH